MHMRPTELPYDDVRGELRPSRADLIHQSGRPDLDPDRSSLAGSSAAGSRRLFRQAAAAAAGWGQALRPSGSRSRPSSGRLMTVDPWKDLHATA
jgi:hypothetical protein